jgi:hypothetical protein
MKKLNEFDFSERPSSSRYASVVKALVDEGTFAVMLERGDAEFPADVKVDTVQTGVRNALRKAGKRARTRIPSDNVVVVGLNPNPAPKRARNKSKVAVAA